MNDTGNVFDASSSLMGSEEVPAHNDPFYEESTTPALQAGDEPDYFITEAPARKRRPRFPGLPSLPRNRLVAAGGLLAGVFVVIALLGAAGSEEGPASPSPAPAPVSTEPQIEESGLAEEGARMDRLVSVEAKRARQAKLNAEAAAAERRAEAKAKARREREKKKAKARPAKQKSHSSTPAPEPQPEPVYEPESSYYEPTEVAPPPAPAPAPSPAPTQEFGIEP